MKKLMQLFVLSLFVFSAAAWAQQDARIGTWKLNLAKSKYDPGPPPKSTTLKFEKSGNNGIKLISDGADAQGKPTHSEYTANYDGKDYPTKGSATADTVALKRIDANTSIRIDKQGSSVSSIIRGFVSKDGKTFTVATISTGGAHNIAVYDRQ